MLTAKHQENMKEVKRKVRKVLVWWVRSDQNPLPHPPQAYDYVAYTQ